MPNYRRPYVRKSARKITYKRKTYMNKGITAKLVRKMIHAEDEKKFQEKFYTVSDWSSTKYLNVSGN